MGELAWVADGRDRGAGIIGQPYALRQAGLVAGVVLLVGLTVTVDWTIRLIVINAKLSGASSFQATMQRCFGRSGLVAISLAQWLLCVWCDVRGRRRLADERVVHLGVWSRFA